jgi:hypothetical protein
MIEPDDAWLEVLPSGLALLVVDLPDDAFGGLQLPRPQDRLRESGGAAISDWQLVVRATMAVVVGPGGYGFEITPTDDALGASVSWVDAVESQRGAIVLVRPKRGSELADRRVRGGFVSLAAGD